MAMKGKMTSRPTKIGAGALLAAFWIARTTVRAGEISIVALTGQAAPDGNGTLDRFEPPVISNSGEAAFVADLVGTAGDFRDNSGIYRGSNSAQLGVVFRGGATPPDGNGIYGDFGRDYVINDSGEVVTLTSIRDAVGGANEGIFRSGGGAGLQVEIVRDGDAVVGGNGSFSSYNTPQVNNNGLVSFKALLSGTSGGVSDREGVYIGDGSQALREVARMGKPAPDGNGTYGGLPQFPSLNDLGQVAFSVRMNSTDEGALDDHAIVRGDGLSPTVVMAREGDGAGTSGQHGLLNDPAINDLGQIAFISSGMRNTSGGADNNTALFKAEQPGISVEIARKGDNPPDGNGTFSSFEDPVLNDAGVLAFLSNLQGTLGGSSDDRAIYRGNESLGLTKIVREGELAPQGGGSFTSLRDPAFNEQGQLAFAAFVAPGDLGLYFFDDLLGLTKVISEGDAFLGSTVSDLFVNTRNSPTGNQRDWLNDFGQVAFQFELADGREGIAIWTPPRISITATSIVGNSYTLHFTAPPGLSGWRIAGSSDLMSFPDDLTPSSSISETSPGSYTATVDISGRGQRYFIRLQR